MAPDRLSPTLELEQYERQAEELVKSLRMADLGVCRLLRRQNPRLRNIPDADLAKAVFDLRDARVVVSLEHGFATWERFSKHIQNLTRQSPTALLRNPLATFLEGSVGHGSTDSADAILAESPQIVESSIHAAAVLGDDNSVRRQLGIDPGRATAAGGPRGWDPLTYLCFSKYLRLDPSRSSGFLRSAEMLLDAGANPNTGFFDNSHQPKPLFESVLYGACGMAHQAELTRLLIERGADPNDEEVAYHAPETYNNAALKVLLHSGKLSPDSLATMLLRKHDWHDRAGVQEILRSNADPNRMTSWHRTPLQHAVLRDNSVDIFEMLLDHGADPALAPAGMSATSMAARRGRGDLLELFQARGLPPLVNGVDRLLGACARNDTVTIRSLTAAEPNLAGHVLAMGGKLLVEFAGNGNTEGVQNLLDLGVPVDATFEGDGYWGMAAGSTALHVAAWRVRHSTVKFLVERGASVNTKNGDQLTPLALAVKACVDSYWTDRRSPESVRALLAAGALASDVDFPSGYAEVDNLLLAYGRNPGPQGLRIMG